jgi:hypothetical protein
MLLTYQIAQDKQDATLNQTASQTHTPVLISTYTVAEKGSSETP